MLTPKADPGYRVESSGLHVPTDIARKRIVLTKDTTQKIDRATRACKDADLAVQLSCKKCGPKVRLQLVRDHETGFMKLICDCAERVLTGGV